MTSQMLAGQPASGTTRKPPADILAGYPRLPRGIVLALSDERAQWLQRVLDAERRGLAAGREIGWREGRESAHAEAVRWWAPAARSVARRAGSPSYAELERLRYGPPGLRAWPPGGLTDVERRRWYARHPGWAATADRAGQAQEGSSRA